MAPIGIFDSGVGGLSIFKELQRFLPNESFVYLADSKNAPYGEKTPKEVIQLCVKNTDFLLQQGCKLIVVACNTATTNAIQVLREKYKHPFIGIEPATKPAALNTKTGKIGVLATKGTLNSSFFLNTSTPFRKHLDIIEVEGIGLVSLIEQGKIAETKPLLEKYIAQMLQRNVDHIVLGCTHYPFLRPIIETIVPTNVTVIDSGEAVAKQTKAVLEQNSLSNNNGKSNSYMFYTNGSKAILELFLEQISHAKHTVEQIAF